MGMSCCYEDERQSSGLFYPYPMRILGGNMDHMSTCYGYVFAIDMDKTITGNEIDFVVAMVGM